MEKHLYSINPPLKIRDVTDRVIAKHSDKRQKCSTPPSTPEDDDTTVIIPPIKKEFAAAAFNDEHTADILPTYFYASNGQRMSTYPLNEIPEQRRAALYSTNSTDDYAARYATMQSTLARYQESLSIAKQRVADTQVEMRALLRQYLDAERELVEAQCRVQHVLQAHAELARHYKKL